MNTETTTKNTIRAMLKSGQFITAPGVFDLVSAKLADRTEAQAIYMTGYGSWRPIWGSPTRAWPPTPTWSTAPRPSPTPSTSR